MNQPALPHGVTEHVELAPYTTMKVGGPARYFARARTAHDVKRLCDWADEQRLDVVVLGEGSNMIVAGHELNVLVIKIELPGFEVLEETPDTVVIRCGGGVNWDELVRRTVNLKLSGMEALSMIPGTVGAAPVQNAGAYGQETADTLTELDAYDRQTKEFVTLVRADCGFGYRRSRFREADTGRFVITSVTFALRKGAPKPPTYERLVKYLDEHSIENPDVAEIREAVMALRGRILPDPSVVPSAGSFFKNPIISAEQLHELQQDHGKVPVFAYGDSFKLSAGWLLDQCGFKGLEKFGLVVWEHHALVITNPHHASYEDLMKLKNYMTAEVKKRFGIQLEQEPLLIGGE